MSWYLNRYAHMTEDRGFRLKIGKESQLLPVARQLVQHGWLVPVQRRKGESAALLSFRFRGDGLDYVMEQLGFYEADNNRPLPEPTRVPPGSKEKLELLRSRCQRGEELHHAEDVSLNFKSWLWWEID